MKENVVLIVGLCLLFNAVIFAATSLSSLPSLCKHRLNKPFARYEVLFPAERLGCKYNVNPYIKGFMSWWTKEL